VKSDWIHQNYLQKPTAIGLKGGEKWEDQSKDGPINFESRNRTYCLSP
jgi:hypothetical protein